MEPLLKEIKKQIAADGTVKYLFALADGNLIETVRMTHAYGNSVCVSSQAGCNMGCLFCASGLQKKVRDLTAEEMLAQVRFAAEDAVTHAVVMGTGEPFDNYEEVLRFCDLLSDGKNPQMIAPRHITVSTCGIVPKILAFAETAKRYHLAISLHAPDNEIRNRLMPVNRKYPVEEVVKAAAAYSRKTKKRVTFEYILLEGINDSALCAEKLAALLSGEDPAGKSFYVNLIPFNPVEEFAFRGTEKAKALRFYDILMQNGVKATLRKEHGTDIAAACGQLRSRKNKM